MDARPPFLYQPWKHHLPFIQSKIRQAYEEGDQEASVQEGIKHMGGSVTDLYIGSYPVETLLREIENFFGASMMDIGAGYQEWLGEKGYRSLAISDGSEWTLKYAGSEHWLHLHPKRHGNLSVRVRGETLRSAFLIVLASMRYGMDPLDRGLAAQVRQGYLGLGPVQELDQRKGLGRAITLLDPR